MEQEEVRDPRGLGRAERPPVPRPRYLTLRCPACSEVYMAWHGEEAPGTGVCPTCGHEVPVAALPSWSEDGGQTWVER
jgi:rRNA maturation endonuclease Nob1